MPTNFLDCTSTTHFVALFLISHSTVHSVHKNQFLDYYTVFANIECNRKGSPGPFCSTILFTVQAPAHSMIHSGAIYRSSVHSSGILLPTLYNYPSTHSTPFPQYVQLLMIHYSVLFDSVVHVEWTVIDSEKWHRKGTRICNRMNVACILPSFTLLLPRRTEGVKTNVEFVKRDLKTF